MLVRMSRTGRLLLLVAVALIAAACGDDEPASVAVGPTTVPNEGLTVYFVGPAAADVDVVRYEHLVEVRVDGAVDGVAERIRAALLAAAQPTAQQRTDGLIAPLSVAAVPGVIVESDTVILDWSSTAAPDELAAWGTSSGSSSINAIVGMVFDNASEVRAIESRVDGSCEAFTLMMQGSGCGRDLRTRWEQYKVATLPPSGTSELTANLDSHLGEDWKNSVVDALNDASSQVEEDALLVGTWWAVADYCVSSTSETSDGCHDLAAAYLVSRLGTDPQFESSHFSGAGAIVGVMNDGYDGTAPYLDLPAATGPPGDDRPGF